MSLRKSSSVARDGKGGKVRRDVRIMKDFRLRYYKRGAIGRFKQGELTGFRAMEST